MVFAKIRKKFNLLALKLNSWHFFKKNKKTGIENIHFFRIEIYSFKDILIFKT